MIVTAPLVIAKRADGSDVYLYEGVEVPDGLLGGEVKRLSDAGLFGEVESDKPARKTVASK